MVKIIVDNNIVILEGPAEEEYWAKLSTSDKKADYTEEELLAMTNAQLSEICVSLGISGSMTKANMVSLILSKQKENSIE